MWNVAQITKQNRNSVTNAKKERKKRTRSVCVRAHVHWNFLQRAKERERNEISDRDLIELY